MEATRRKIKWGIILIAWPFLALVVAFVLFAIVNWLVGASVEAPTSPGGNIQDGVNSIPGSASDETNIFTTIVNIALFLLGAAAVFLGLPSIIVGIILLATSGKSKFDSSSERPDEHKARTSVSSSTKGAGMGIAGIVLGITSIVLWFIGFILGVLAIIFSSIGIKRKQGKGLAVAGLVTGIIGTVIGFIVGVAFIVGIISASYASVEQRAEDSLIESQAATIQKQAELFNADNGRYPSFEEIRYEVWQSDPDIIISAQGSSSAGNTIYIPCYGDGAIIWHWDDALEEYEEIEIGSPSSCEWNE